MSLVVTQQRKHCARLPDARGQACAIKSCPLRDHPEGEWEQRCNPHPTDSTSNSTFKATGESTSRTVNKTVVSFHHKSVSTWRLFVGFSSSTRMGVLMYLIQEGKHLWFLPVNRCLFIYYLQYWGMNSVLSMLAKLSTSEQPTQALIFNKQTIFEDG